MPWQVRLAGTWQDFKGGEEQLLESQYKAGQREFQIVSRGNTYNIDLTGDSWTQTNKATGKAREIRIWPPPTAPELPPETPAETPVEETNSARTPPTNSRGGTIMGPAPTSRVAETPMSFEHLRIYVWLSGEWHPVSLEQDREIKQHLQEGNKKFPIAGGRFTIDTEGKSGWVQIGKGGRERRMKYEAATPATPAAPAAPTQTPAVPGEEHHPPAIPEDGPADLQETTPHAELRPPVASVPSVARVKSDFAGPQRRITEDKRRGGLIKAVEAEWAAVSGGSTKSLGKEQLMQGWKKAYEDASREDQELVQQVITDIFNKVDLGKNGRIEQAEWVHYRLLENQAPSFHAMAQVNEVLVRWCKVDSGFIQRLVTCFKRSEATSDDPRLTANEMREAAKAWEGELGVLSGRLGLRGGATKSPSDLNVDDVMEHLRDIINDTEGEIIEEDLTHTYYDFLNHLLARRAKPVEIYLYDISGGKAAYVAPCVVGQCVEGIWHSGVVVHNKEYWFGGKIFESAPGSTPFGTPVKKVELEEKTMRTRNDLWNFIRRELASEYTTNNYDVLMHNCNHFANDVVLFLANQRMPDEVMKQPEIAMNSLVFKAFKPLLNKWLGGFENEETDSRVTDSSATKEEWLTVDDLALVIYEYEPGWTCIARLLEKDATQCKLKYLNFETHQFETQRNVSRVQVSPLQTQEPKSAKRKGPQQKPGGMFASCYQPATTKAE